MSGRWTYRTDPLYRWLLAESADLEWQCIEHEFLADLVRADGDPIELAEVSIVRAALRCTVVQRT